MVNEAIRDYLRDSQILQVSKYYALKEAFYGLKCDFELAWYLSKPFSNADYNVDLYFELWKNQADYLITDNNILLIRTNT